MTMLSRLLVGTAALLLLSLFLLPLWQVRLVAPQYPEGLGMHIHINTVVGATETDLDNINNLNHYIGMQRIEANAIPELAVMPWIVAVLVATGLAVAAAGRRTAFFAWLGAFTLLGVAGLADFWRWEYDYGHRLDLEHAIIKIPGMSYQPPLIGSRQLLNFTATSWPDTGGIAAGVAFALALAALVLILRAPRNGANPARRADAAPPAIIPHAASHRG